MNEELQINLEMNSTKYFFHEMYDQLPEPPRSRYGAPSHHFITNMRWKPDSSVTITKDRYHSENRQGFRNATYENDLNQLKSRTYMRILNLIAKPLGVVSGFWILAHFLLVRCTIAIICNGNICRASLYALP